MEQKSPKIAKIFQCVCGKEYKIIIWFMEHKKNVLLYNKIIINYVVQENPEEKPSMMDIITQNKEIMDALVLQNEQLMKQNTELTNTIKEIVPKIGNNNTTNNNNQFNYKFF